MSATEQQQEPIEGILVREVEGTDVLESLTRGEIDQQIRTAKAWPRSIKKFQTEAREMACLSADVAASCIYALPRGGKTIQGPSARMAEIVMSAWGNCRSGARTIAEDERFVTAQGFFHDLERNVAVTFEVRRRVTDSRGKTYNDDMISVTANAACSIALRNAVFKGVPKAFWQPVYEAARKTAIGEAKSLTDTRNKMIDQFGKMGVTVDRILAALDKPGIEDIGEDEIIILRGAYSSLMEGEFTTEQVFPPINASQPKEQQGGTAGLAANLAQMRAAKKPDNGDKKDQGTAPVQTSTPHEEQTASSATPDQSSGSGPLFDPAGARAKEMFAAANWVEKLAREGEQWETCMPRVRKVMFETLRDLVQLDPEFDESTFRQMAEGVVDGTIDKMTTEHAQEITLNLEEAKQKLKEPPKEAKGRKRL